MSDSTEHVSAALEQEPQAPAVEYAVTPLSDILDRDKEIAPRDTGGQPDMAVAPTDRVAETGDKDVRPRDEAGRFAPRVAPPAAETVSDAEPPETGHVPVSALKSERAKRQEYERKVADQERQLAELRAQLGTSPQQQQQPSQQQQIPNPATDPAGYHAYMMYELDRRDFNTVLNQDERRVREKYDDVDEAIAAFKVAREADPRLTLELEKQKHPWEWAYKQGKKLAVLQKISAEDDPVAGLEAEVERRVAARLAKSQPSNGSAPPPVNLPGSLASSRGVGDRASPPPASWTPIDQIVRFKG